MRKSEVFMLRFTLKEVALIIGCLTICRDIHEEKSKDWNKYNRLLKKVCLNTGCAVKEVE